MLTCAIPDEYRRVTGCAQEGNRKVTGRLPEGYRSIREGNRKCTRGLPESTGGLPEIRDVKQLSDLFLHTIGIGIFLQDNGLLSKS